MGTLMMWGCSSVPCSPPLLTHTSILLFWRCSFLSCITSSAQLFHCSDVAIFTAQLFHCSDVVICPIMFPVHLHNWTDGVGSFSFPVHIPCLGMLVHWYRRVSPLYTGQCFPVTPQGSSLHLIHIP